MQLLPKRDIVENHKLLIFDVLDGYFQIKVEFEYVQKFEEGVFGGGFNFEVFIS